MDGKASPRKRALGRAIIHGRTGVIVAAGESARTAHGEERLTVDSIELRRCHGIEEFRACVALQKEVWNFTDAELIPLRMFVVADKVGGQVMGAFENKE